jgi:uncharacterized protein (TIGR00156 family)
MKNIYNLAIIGTIGLLSTGIANAQYTGPSLKEMTTVSEVLANAKDDTYVQLKGKITKQVGKEKYTFVDSSGEIRVEIDNEVFTVPVDDKTTVEIRGEFEKDFMQSPEIDVDSVIISK